MLITQREREREKLRWSLTAITVTTGLIFVKDSLIF